MEIHKNILPTELITIFIYAKNLGSENSSNNKITDKIAQIIKKIEKKTDITFQNNNVFMDYTNDDTVTLAVH